MFRFSATSKPPQREAMIRKNEKALFPLWRAVVFFAVMGGILGLQSLPAHAGGQGAAAQAPSGGPSARAALLTSELFIAIRDGDPSAASAALARGADPNGTNWLGFTPLMWAAARGNQTIADRLLARGAKIEATSIYGTALDFALIGRHENMALYLLQKGANIHPDRVDGATPLMLAACNGYAEVIRHLLQRKDNPNRQDHDGATALIYAARLGQTASAQVLMNAGAGVNAADSHGRTALMYAAAGGHLPMVDLLLGRRARVDARDKGGDNALLLAAHYSGDPAVISRLLQKGADASARDSRGRTPLSLAAARGYGEAETLLHTAGAAETAPASPEMTAGRTRKAIETSLVALQTGMKTFAQRAACTSCHHQGLGLMTMGLAQQHGFTVDKALIGGYLQRMGEEGMAGAPLIHQALSDPDAAKTVQAVDIGDISVGAGYIFGGMIANGIPPNPGLAETALFLAKQQAPDGHWGFGFTREPIQSSYVTTTALVLHVLRSYAPQDKADQLASCYQHAKQWLLAAAAPQTEDKASRLLGLNWVGANPQEREQPLRELLAAQRPDGGWAQLPSLRSDAYATGLALYALHAGGGVATTDPAYQRGVQFLLRTQDEDGSWYVNKRTMPANVYFDAGFPHGESQYISFGATCWATMALLQTVEPPQAASR